MDDRKAFIKKMHDLALNEKPEGAEHDAASCEICIEQARLDDPDQFTGGEIVETFTNEQVEAAIAKAVEPFKARVAELEAAQADSAVAQAVEAAKAEAAEELARVQSELDAAQIEKNEAVAAAESAKAEFDAFKTELADLEAAEKAAAEREGRKAERIEKVKEVAKFDDDEIAAKADRWADMDDADFASLVDDYKSVAAKAAASKGGETPVVETAMTTVTPETAALQGGESALSFISEASAVGYRADRKF